MPVWSLDELQRIADQYSMNLGSVTERNCLIGGIPRFVLEKTNEDLSIIIRDAVKSLNIDKFELIAEGKNSKEDKFSHLIVHYTVDSGFKMTTVQFSSVYVTEMALDVFVLRQHQRLRKFLQCSERSSTISDLEGIFSKLTRMGFFLRVGNLAIETWKMESVALLLYQIWPWAGSAISAIVKTTSTTSDGIQTLHVSTLMSQNCFYFK
jgi:hypothetical protein